MGGRRVPTRLKILRGTDQPCRTNQNEPEPEAEIGTAPDSLGELEQTIWGEIVEESAPGVLTNQDRLSLELVCIGFAEIRRGNANASDRDRVFRQLGKLGMTPAERNNVVVQKPPSRNVFKPM